MQNVAGGLSEECWYLQTVMVVAEMLCIHKKRGRERVVVMATWDPVFRMQEVRQAFRSSAQELQQQ